MTSTSGASDDVPNPLLPRYTLKEANTFLLTDSRGDIQRDVDGLFCEDTRVLSRLELTIAGRHPSVLGAAISQDNTVFTAHLTNRPLPALGERVIPQGVIHIERSRFLWSGRVYERLRLTNFGGEEAPLTLGLVFAADFADIFEVQGHRRKERGELLPPKVTEAAVQLSYLGLDRRLRTTVLRFSETPAEIDGTQAQFTIELRRGASYDLYVEIGSGDTHPPAAGRFVEALRGVRDDMTKRLQEGASITTSGQLFTDWLQRSRADLALLTAALPTGPYPYAGIPWFATPFGRDAVITSLQTLWLYPTLAAGVLRFLALTQAQERSAFRDSEPGKIMHEMRRGEMAALDEVPFRQYYGGVDTTPLFVMLAVAYEERTGDRELIDEIWGNLLAAIAWVEQRLDRSPSGFLDYARGAESGLANQGWKDSYDSIFHADGRLPSGPVAVVEVQGYAYAALLGMSQLAAARADPRGAQWCARAERLRRLIEERFWIERMGGYALAIDGDGTPCAVAASNVGHLLYCGAVQPERGARVAQQLLSSRFCSGWGIRTLASGEARFNPMSYHNGSVWPHDTALCAAGIARYVGRGPVVQLLGEIFEAATHFSMRLPELYCGFTRLVGQGPTPYPVACMPQAWASGSSFMLLQACLGMRIDGRRREIHVERPLLPVGIEALGIRGLRVGEVSVDLEFQRVGNNVVVVPDRHAAGEVAVLAHL
jgi:glycogen debranching enzyme